MAVDIDIGADVEAADGRPVGTVQGVVMDPLLDVVTHLVIRSGLAIAPVDKVVPVTAVERIADHRVRLNITMVELEEQPNLEERAYVPLAPTIGDTATPRIWTPPPPVALPPVINPNWGPPFVVEEWRNVPEEEQVLREGLPVRARDGELVGTVDEIVTDPATHVATHIAVHSRREPTRDKLIPVAWIVRSDEDTGITLGVNRDAVEGLPNYH